MMEKAYGLEIPQNLADACNAQRTALLVYDMQVGVIRQIPDGPQIVARVKLVLEAARAAGVRVFFMRHTPGFQLVSDLNPLPSEVIFDKITMSAFEGTPLDIALRDCGINSFIIVGVATEIGIEPTVRHGADLGYLPIVVADACGAGHADAGARAMASIRFMGDAIMTDSRSILDVLR